MKLLVIGGGPGGLRLTWRSGRGLLPPGVDRPQSASSFSGSGQLRIAHFGASQKSVNSSWRAASTAARPSTLV
jgi:hypothetical protein